MTKESRKPELRFDGFEDAWEQRKVGEMIEDYVEKTIIQNQFPVLTSSQQQGIVLQEEYFADRQVTTDDNIGYYVLPKGYFTYRSRSDTNTFVFNRNDIIDKGIISYYYPVFKANNADSNFLLRRLNHGTKSQLSFIAEGTGQKVLAHSKFKNIAVYVPSIEEQKSIGSFFENLDTLITLHQRKYEKLTKVKKSMLEKMFPHDGADVPEIRFAGFTDAWEQRKLGEITKVLSASRVHKEEWASDGVPFFRSSDVVSAFKGNNNDRVYISQELYEELIKSSGKLQQGDILITGGGSIGIPYIVPDNEPLYSKDADLIWIKKSTKHDSHYLYTYFISPKFRDYISGISHIGTIAHYTIEQVEDTPIPLPNMAEQEVIGSFFCIIDALITLHQRKLEKLKNIKKSCLKKMFV